MQKLTNKEYLALVGMTLFVLPFSVAIMRAWWLPADTRLYMIAILGFVAILGGIKIISEGFYRLKDHFGA